MFGKDDIYVEDKEGLEWEQQTQRKWQIKEMHNKSWEKEDTRILKDSVHGKKTFSVSSNWVISSGYQIKGFN